MHYSVTTTLKYIDSIVCHKSILIILSLNMHIKKEKTMPCWNISTVYKQNMRYILLIYVCCIYVWVLCLFCWRILIVKRSKNNIGRIVWLSTKRVFCEIKYPVIDWKLIQLFVRLYVIVEWLRKAEVLKGHALKKIDIYAILYELLDLYIDNGPSKHCQHHHASSILSSRELRRHNLA